MILAWMMKCSQDHFSIVVPISCKSLHSAFKLFLTECKEQTNKSLTFSFFFVISVSQQYFSIKFYLNEPTHPFMVRTCALFVFYEQSILITNTHTIAHITCVVNELRSNLHHVLIIRLYLWCCCWKSAIL